MSFWEVVVILIVALIVIKPERFPEISYMLGKALGRLKYLSQAIFQKFNSPQ